MDDPWDSVVRSIFGEEPSNIALFCYEGVKMNNVKNILLEQKENN
ncbi:MAG: hypothetical protein V3T40_06845 [Nitrososphaerales archaeon]